MDEKERYETVIKDLSQAIHHLTWLGEFWGLKGALALDIIRYRYFEKLNWTVKSLSARSSLYYSATGNAKARTSENILLKPFWLVVGLLCFLRAIYFSDQFAKIGLYKMTVGEMDVRASIMYKAKRYREALYCINHALSWENVASHSKVLLSVKKADILAAQGDIYGAHALYEEAMKITFIHAGTLVRLNKSYAGFLIKYRQASAYPKALEKIKALESRI